LLPVNLPGFGRKGLAIAITLSQRNQKWRKANIKGKIETQHFVLFYCKDNYFLRFRRLKVITPIAIRICVVTS
jgi:hypothetical protein